MEKKFSVGLISLAALLLLEGCGTSQLAQSPKGQDEVRWEGFIKSNYSEWKAPQIVPPSAADEPAAAPSLADIPALPPMDTGVAGKGADIPATPAESQTYTVGKGDSLWTISKKFYGKGSHWQIILDANKDKIPDPNKMKDGTVLSIPPKP